MAAVAEQRELVLGDAEALQHLLGFAEVGGAAADEGQRIAQEIVDARASSRARLRTAVMSQGLAISAKGSPRSRISRKSASGATGP